jgi:hypothetical protein
MNSFLSRYRSVKSSWSATVDKSSQGPIKKLMNGLLWGQRISSFDPSEWGDLSDFVGLQDELQKANAARIDETVGELLPVVSALESIVNELRDIIAAIDPTTPLYSMKSDLLRPYLEQLAAAYVTELRLRRQIVSDLLTHKFDEAPHDVITTITAMWSGRVYTNDRAIGHIEKFLEFEAAAAQR